MNNQTEVKTRPSFGVLWQKYGTMGIFLLLLAVLTIAKPSSIFNPDSIPQILKQSAVNILLDGFATKEGKTFTFLGGDAMGISKDCKHVAQAWNFLAWLMSDDAQKEVFAANGDTASNIQTLKTAYDDADPRVQTINSVIIDGNGQTPKSAAFNEAFNAAGSPWQLLIQNAVWGDGDLKADNQAITDVLGQ